MTRGGVPGRRIGTLDAADVNVAIRRLAKLVAEEKLPPKVLVVHRFTRGMLTGTERSKLDPRVQVVIDMDGFGASWHKEYAYRHFISPYPVQYTGFKLFYKNDRLTRAPSGAACCLTAPAGRRRLVGCGDDGLMTPRQVLHLLSAAVVHPVSIASEARAAGVASARDQIFRIAPPRRWPHQYDPPHAAPLPGHGATSRCSGTDQVLPEGRFRLFRPFCGEQDGAERLAERDGPVRRPSPRGRTERPAPSALSRKDRAEDELTYDEPPDWPIPLRQPPAPPSCSPQNGRKSGSGLPAGPGPVPEQRLVAPWPGRGAACGGFVLVRPAPRRRDSGRSGRAPMRRRRPRASEAIDTGCTTAADRGAALVAAS